jgi:superfamily II DNA or RNA helicase
MSESFEALTARLDAEQWRALGVLACEHKLALGAFEKLGFAERLHPWLAGCVERGLLLDAGVVHGLDYTRRVLGERAISIAPSCRSLVMRHFVASEAFETLRCDARAVAGNKSVGGFMIALYSGDMPPLLAELTELRRRQVRDEGERFARDRLREAVSAPFDANWLSQTWRQYDEIIGEQVLADALTAFEPVDALYQWLLSRVDEKSNARTLRILAEHALLRGEAATVAALTLRLPPAEQLPLRVAECFLSGNLPQAQAMMDELGGSKYTTKSAVPCPTTVTAILSLLALSRGQPAGATLAKRLFQRFSTTEAPPIAGWPMATSQTAVGRGLRLLLRRLTQPESERLRLSPHHQPVDAPGWETLIQALTVQCQDCDTVTRTAWTRRLVDDSARWSDGRYHWVARQALQLAKTLSVEPMPELQSMTPGAAGEPLLVHLLEREPEWRCALRALDKYVETAERGETMLSRRVAWFMDMTSGDLAKPGLEEYRSGTGWTRGHRVDFDELRSLKDTLPPEDVTILSAIDAAPRGTRLPLAAIEALIGHPRVFNGARARQHVEVVRGNCHVETHQDHGHLVIQMEPSGAGEGVNVVVESETRLVVYRVNASLARLIQLLPTGLRIPQAHQNEGLAILSRLAEHVEIRSAELGACRTVVADSTPCVRISAETGAWWVEIGVRPYGELGRFFPPGLGRSVVTVHGGDELFDTERCFNEEEARYHALLAKCPTLREASLRGRTDENGSDPVHAFGLNEEELFCLLTELRECGLACALEWKDGHAITARGKVSGAALHGSMRRVKGWYLINGSIQVDQVSPLALSDLVRMPFTKSGRFIRLPNGDFVEVERRIRHVLSQLASVAQLPARGSPGELRVPESAFDTLRALLDSESAMEVEPSATEWLSRLDATLSSEAACAPGLEATLRSYQFEGYQWLWRLSQLGLGACLADDMGLGKTVQVIALLLVRSAAGPALVIAPTSVCTNWVEELNRFAPSLRAVEYAGKSRTALLEQFKQNSGARGPDVLIASYALLQQDSAELAAIEWNTAVLDEAQFIKNPHSMRAKAAFQLSARYRVVMTGTPIENHLGDLWSIFHFLNPALLGSFKHFQLSYLKPIERDHASEQQALLKKLVQPFLLRRRKDEVLQDLPPITTLRHEVRLNEDETLRYALLRRQIHDKLHSTYGKRDHKLQVLAEITRLRRFCCHPRLVFPDVPTESSKLQTFLELAEELHDNGHRALVFSQFVDFLQLVREQLDERKLSYLYLDGSTPKETRQARVKAFQAGEAALFLISLKAGGFGLNLTAADYVIHLDPWWNPAVEAQATDRAHRIGQERPVTVYRLVTKDTIEERIVELHQEKRAIAEAVLDETASGSDLTSEALLELLGLG